MEIGQHPNAFADEWLSRMQNDACKSSFAFLANLLSEIICPEMTSFLTWPDEEMLKFTVERWAYQ